MRNLKKFLALVLSMMMVLSLFVTASATSIDKDGKGQSFGDTAETEFLTAIEVLNGMDVLKGDADPATGALTGNFRPTANITRAEVAALVFRLSTGMTGVNDADHYAQYGNFSDVKKDAWYAGYVGYCANAGYIKGYAGEYGPFGPSDPVTGYQALAMILRAMGYGVNGEFEGTNWQLNVSAVGTQTKILDNINNTHFGGATLQAAAQRQVVAEIYYQAALTPTVVYTPAYGYQTNNMTNANTNQGSLGWQNFGLTKETRIVLGNQATGETNTLVGALTSKGDYAYEYPFVNVVNEEGTVVRTTEGRTLKVETGIELFGHKVEVHYDGRGAVTSAARTYAISDQANSTIVYAKDNDLLDELGSAAADAKFTVDKFNGAHTSDRYGRIDWDTPQGVNAADFTPVDSSYFSNATDATIKEDVDGSLPYGIDDVNGAGPEEGSYFMLISNSTNSKLDVVITLAPELARITEHNTTVTPNTLRLSGKSDVAMLGTPIKPSTFGENDDGVVRMNSLTATSDKTLGDLVVAWEIKGTNYTLNYNGEVVKGNTNEYFYQLDKVEKTLTGVVQTYNPDNGTVTLVGGKQLRFTLLPIINEAVSAPTDPNNSDLYFYNGVEYTFYLDPTDETRYVTYDQGHGYEFLYATFADHETGALGTGTISYAVTGVNWNGDRVLIQPFTSIDKVGVNGTSYEALTIAKKNMGGATNTVGNEMQAGLYTGYGYNAETKDLDVEVAGVTADNWDTRTDGTYWDGKLTSDFDMDDTDGEGVWTVDKGNVADGWADQTVTNRGGLVGQLLLTPSTKFILVSGTGSATLNVDIRNGIADLLRDSNSVTIDVNRYKRDASNVIEEQLADYNVYYQVADEQFNNWYKDQYGISYSDDNYMVKTVILPLEAVEWSSKDNLYFTNKVNATGVYLADTSAATTSIRQFELYQNGERGLYFIDTAKSYTSHADNWAVAADTDIGMFFELVQIDTKNGTPIYQAIEMDYPELDNVYWSQNSKTVCDVDLKYDYTAVNNVNTARLTQRGNFTVHSTPGSLSNVYNVTGAKVVNLSGVGTINSVQTLNNAVSIGYDVTVAIVNDGHSVSIIYVTAVDDTAVVK